MLFVLSSFMAKDNTKGSGITSALRQVPALDPDTPRVPAASALARVPSPRFPLHGSVTVVEGDITLEDVTGSTTAGLETPLLGSKLGICSFPAQPLLGLEGYLVMRPAPLSGYFGLLSALYVLTYQAGEDPLYGYVHAHPSDLLSRRQPPRNPSFSESLYTLRRERDGQQFSGVYGAIVRYLKFDHSTLFAKSFVEIVNLATTSSFQDAISSSSSEVILAIPLFIFEDKECPDRSLTPGLVLRRFKQSTPLE